MAHLFKRSDALAHDWYFARTIVDFLDGNGTCRASINRAGVIANRDELALIVEYRPILLDKAVDECLCWLVKMGKVKLRTEFLAVLGFVVD